MADEKSLVRISHRLFAISRSEMRISMKIPFSPPDITEEEIIQVTEALKSGWITTGPRRCCSGVSEVDL